MSVSFNFVTVATVCQITAEAAIACPLSASLTSRATSSGPPHYAPAPAERNVAVGYQRLPFPQSTVSHGQLGNRCCWLMQTHEHRGE